MSEINFFENVNRKPNSMPCVNLQHTRRPKFRVDNLYWKVKQTILLYRRADGPAVANKVSRRGVLLLKSLDFGFSFLSVVYF